MSNLSGDLGFWLQLALTVGGIGMVYGATRAEISALKERVRRLEGWQDGNSKVMAYVRKTMPAPLGDR